MRFRKQVALVAAGTAVGCAAVIGWSLAAAPGPLRVVHVERTAVPTEPTRHPPTGYSPRGETTELCGVPMSEENARRLHLGCP
ncbi:hypothetical protein [Saccharopolyspora cebuensis]|uniref:Secreted protein n=1 Tax=Saccharopolyspora cebuensis TaxID=418759 RepID=A0ABV4CG42_9PSEU